MEKIFPLLAVFLLFFCQKAVSQTDPPFEVDRDYTPLAVGKVVDIIEHNYGFDLVVEDNSTLECQRNLAFWFGDHPTATDVSEYPDVSAERPIKLGDTVEVSRILFSDGSTRFGLYLLKKE